MSLTICGHSGVSCAEVHHLVLIHRTLVIPSEFSIVLSLVIFFCFSTNLTTPDTLTSSPVTPQENLGGSARLWTLRDMREIPALREEMSVAIRDTFF